MRTKNDPTKWPINEPAANTIPNAAVYAVSGHGSNGLPFQVPVVPVMPHISSFKQIQFPSAHPLMTIEPKQQNGNVEEIADSIHLNENLNPDVPEFVPVTARLTEEMPDKNNEEPVKTEELEKKVESLKLAEEGKLSGNLLKITVRRKNLKKLTQLLSNKCYISAIPSSFYNPIELNHRNRFVTQYITYSNIQENVNIKEKPGKVK